MSFSSVLVLHSYNNVMILVLMEESRLKQIAIDKGIFGRFFRMILGSPEPYKRSVCDLVKLSQSAFDFRGLNGADGIWWEANTSPISLQLNQS